MNRKISESIYDGKDYIIPMEQVAYIEKAPRKEQAKHWHGIWVHFKSLAKPVWITRHERQAEQFIQDFCQYRSEFEGIFDQRVTNSPPREREVKI